MTNIEQVGLRGPEVPAAADPRRWWALSVLCLSLVLITLDNTVLNVALPTLVGDLHASTSQLQWIVDSYQLVFAGLLFSAGSLADRYGRKGTLQAGLVIFGLGTLDSALAGNAGTLIATRAYMGIGGALIMPSTLSILGTLFPDPSERTRAIALWAAMAAVGIALGPVLVPADESAHDSYLEPLRGLDHPPQVSVDRLPGRLVRIEVIGVVGEGRDLEVVVVHEVSHRFGVEPLDIYVADP